MHKVKAKTKRKTKVAIKKEEETKKCSHCVMRYAFPKQNFFTTK